MGITYKEPVLEAMLVHYLRKKSFVSFEFECMGKVHAFGWELYKPGILHRGDYLCSAYEVHVTCPTCLYRMRYRT